jgi:hypothetical protein
MGTVVFSGRCKGMWQIDRVEHTYIDALKIGLLF